MLERLKGALKEVEDNLSVEMDKKEFDIDKVRELFKTHEDLEKLIKLEEM